MDHKYLTTCYVGFDHIVNKDSSTTRLVENAEKGNQEKSEETELRGMLQNQIKIHS